MLRSKQNGDVEEKKAHSTIIDWTSSPTFKHNFEIKSVLSNQTFIVFKTDAFPIKELLEHC